MADIIQINTLGPQGSKGDQGPKGDPGQLTKFVDLTVTGSLHVSGNLLQGNITGSTISASDGFVGDLTGTSSFAEKLVHQEKQVGIGFNIPFLLDDGRVFVNRNDGFTYNPGDKKLKVKTIENDSNVNDTLLTGSFTGSFVGTLVGTASSAHYASQATTSSHALTASFLDIADDRTGVVSSSYALTASHALNADGAGFPFTGSAEITGSLKVVGPLSASNLNLTEGGVTVNSNTKIGSIYTHFGTEFFQGVSQSTSPGGILTGDGGVYLKTYLGEVGLNVEGYQGKFTIGVGGIKINPDKKSAGNNFQIYNNGPGPVFGVFPNTDAVGAQIQLASPESAFVNIGHTTSDHNYKLYVKGDTLIEGDLNLSGGALDVPISASTPISASVVSASTFFGNGQNLTGIGGNPFPYEGNAEVKGDISASLGGDVYATNFYGSGQNLTGIGSNPFPFTGSANVTGSIAVIGSSTVTGSSIISGSSTIEGPSEITGSLNITGPITALDIISASGFSGSLEGTASFATTASYALNVPEDSGFPFTGSAEITGSLNVIGPLSASSLNITGPVTASEVISASGNISASAFYGDGSFLTGTNVTPFPFTGSANISGSIVATSTIQGTTGSFDKVNAEQFVSTGTGVPKITSATKLVLSASEHVEVNNILKLIPTTSESVSLPTSGSIIFDSNTGKFRGWNGIAWVDFH